MWEAASWGVESLCKDVRKIQTNSLGKLEFTCNSNTHQNVWVFRTCVKSCVLHLIHASLPDAQLSGQVFRCNRLPHFLSLCPGITPMNSNKSKHILSTSVIPWNSWKLWQPATSTQNRKITQHIGHMGPAKQPYASAVPRNVSLLFRHQPRLFARTGRKDNVC